MDETLSPEQLKVCPVCSRVEVNRTYARCPRCRSAVRTADKREADAVKYRRREYFVSTGVRPPHFYIDEVGWPEHDQGRLE